MVDEKYIIDIKGKKFILYEGLLNEAHLKGLASIEVTLVQFPISDNGTNCICKASVIGQDGHLYSDYGDASPQSVDIKLVPHIIRMASTRAKARALRDFTNIGMCSLEEINPSEIEADVSELATLPQINLLQRLCKERKVAFDFDGLTKKKAALLIEQLSKKKVAGHI